MEKIPGGSSELFRVQRTPSASGQKLSVLMHMTISVGKENNHSQKSFKKMLFCLAPNLVTFLDIFETNQVFVTEENFDTSLRKPQTNSNNFHTKTEVKSY